MNQNYKVNENQYDEQTKQKILAARSRGYSEQQIKVLADRTGSPMNFAGGQAPVKKEGFLQSLVKPVVNYGKLLGEGVFQGGRALIDPVWRKATFQGVDKLTPEELKKLSESKATMFMNPEDTQVPTSVDEFLNKPNVLKYGLKATAGTAAFAVPGGSTLKSAAALGALSGGLYGLSEGENFDPAKIATSAVTGAGTGLLLKGGEQAFGKAKDLFSRGKDRLAEKAAANVTKTSGSVYQKAADFGMDLNEIVQKHGLGVGYDEALGTVAERGRGGIIGKQIAQNEGVINQTVKTASNIKVSGEDFVKALMEEKKLLSKIPGNQEKSKALDAIIQETRKMFKSGMSPNRLLTLKRAADSKFGKAVVEEQVGSVATSAQKILANTARAKLKQMFPDIANALDNESELLTIKPVLEMARSKVKASGLKLSQFDITKPGTLIDPLLNNPTVAGKLAGAGAPTAEAAATKAGGFFDLSKSPTLQFASKIPGAQTMGDISKGIINQAGVAAPRVVGADVAGAFAGTPDQSQTVQQPAGAQPTGDQGMVTDPNGQWKYDPSTKTITDMSGQWAWDDNAQDWVPNQAMNPATATPSKEQFRQAIVLATKQGNSKKLALLQDAYKSLYPAEKPPTAQQIKDMLNAQSGLDNLAKMKERIASDPNVLVKAALPGSIGARDYNRWAKEVSDVYTRLRTGAALNVQEIEFYDSQLPGLLDYNNPQNIASALEIFQNLFDKVANQQAGNNAVIDNNFTFSTGEPPVVGQ